MNCPPKVVSAGLLLPASAVIINAIKMKRGSAMNTATRIEHDTMGEIAVPAERHWGAQTQRSLENFRIGAQRQPKEIITAFACLKEACARATAAAGKLTEEQAAAVEILAGFHVGFQTTDVGIGKRHGHSLAVVGQRDTHMDKNILIPRGYSCRYRKCRTTFLPTDIPTKCLDASGRGWTSGNRTGSKKERMPMSFGLWHSSLYLNLASPNG